MAEQSRLNVCLAHRSEQKRNLYNWNFTVMLQDFVSATKDCDGIWPFINAVDDGGRPKTPLLNTFKTFVKFWGMFQPGKVYISFRMAPAGLQGMSRCLMESGQCHNSESDEIVNG